MNRITDKSFWYFATMRALRTGIQGILIGLTGCVTIQDANWVLVLSSCLMGMITSFLTSILAGLPETEFETQTDVVEAIIESRKAIEKEKIEAYIEAKKEAEEDSDNEV